MRAHQRKSGRCSIGRSFPAIVASALIAIGCSEQSPVAPPTNGALGIPQADRVDSRGQALSTRHVIIGVNGQITPALLASVKAMGGSIERTHGEIGVLTARGLSDAAAATLASRADVDGVSRDTVLRWIPRPAQLVHSTVSMPATRTDQSGAAFFDAYQWNMRVIRANNAWKVTPQGKNTLACILDTGVDPDHIDLVGKINLGKSTSFVVTEPDILDHNFHGTYVSAIISSNGIGVASVAPDAKLCMIKVLDQTGTGSFADIISGIVYAADVHADVINMSLGAYFSKKEPGAKQLIKAIQRAVNYAASHGVLVVAAAGNDTVDTNHDPRDMIDVPAQLDNVLSVGATAPVNQMNFDQIASYSNYGSQGVDVFAPGGDLVAGGVLQDLIISACSRYATELDCSSGEDNYAFAAGTSAAAPHAAGEGLVIESVIPRNQPGFLLDLCIIAGADHPTGRIVDPVYSHGRINVLGGAHCSPVH